MSATATRQRRHDDTPDTGGAFLRLSRLPSGPERDALREAIICAWLPVAKRLALRFRNKGENMEDLTQVASLALVKAVDRYNPDLGHAFPPMRSPSSRVSSSATSATICGRCTSPATSRRSAPAPAPRATRWSRSSAGAPPPSTRSVCAPVCPRRM
ncbi:sigma factor [Streptomyces indonesiensis]